MIPLAIVGLVFATVVPVLWVTRYYKLEYPEEFFEASSSKSTSTPRSVFTWLFGAQVFFAAAMANLLGYVTVSHWLYQHRPVGHGWILPAITLLVGLQYPWLFTLGSYRGLKHKLIRQGADSGALRSMQRGKFVQLIFLYLMLVLMIVAVSSFLR